MPTTIAQDIVSVLSGLTVYPVTVPSNATYPNCTYQKISKVNKRSHSGNGLNRYRYQISVYGKTHASCEATANTVKGLLDLNQTNFTLVTEENEQEIVEAQTGLYSTKIDFYIWSHK